MVTRQIHAAQRLAELTQTCAAVQEEMGHQLRTAVAEGNEQTATATCKAMWEAIYPVYKAISELGDIWNQLAPRVT